jgi:DNA-binding GntR family transcriptional regulator
MGRSVYESIRSAILECTFLPGMALSEQAVSDELQVSRAPVREAFRQLSVEGLLESVPQRGSFVALLSRAKVADAIFVRDQPPWNFTTSGTISSATMLMILISGLMAGPAVSL